VEHFKELLADKSAECAVMNHKEVGMESDIHVLKTRLEEKEELLRAANSSGVRLQGTVDRLETSLARIKKEKLELEKKLKSSYESSAGGIVMSGSRVRELERELNEANRNHREAELELEEKILILTTEKSDLDGRISSLEERLRQVSADSSSQRRESTLTAQELYRLQSRLDKEIADHKKTQAALQSIQHLEEDWRMAAEGSTAMMEEEEKRSENNNVIVAIIGS
jgi:microcompartment protein CcmK/EutM